MTSQTSNQILEMAANFGNNPFDILAGWFLESFPWFLELFLFGASQDSVGFLWKKFCNMLLPQLTGL